MLNNLALLDQLYNDLINNEFTSQQALRVKNLVSNCFNVSPVSLIRNGLSYPYISPENAIDNAISGDLIEVWQTFNVTKNLAKNGVDWYLGPNVTINNTTGTQEAIWDDKGSAVSFNIFGEGNLYRDIPVTVGNNVANVEVPIIKLKNANSVVNVVFNQLLYRQNLITGTFDYGTYSGAFQISGGTLRVKGKKAYIYDYGGPTSSSGNDIYLIHLDKTGGASNVLIDIDEIYYPEMDGDLDTLIRFETSYASPNIFKLKSKLIQFPVDNTKELLDANSLPSGDIYLDVDRIENGSIQIYDSSGSKPNFTLNTKELLNPNIAVDCNFNFIGNPKITNDLSDTPSNNISLNSNQNITAANQSSTHYVPVVINGTTYKLLLHS